MEKGPWIDGGRLSSGHGHVENEGFFLGYSMPHAKDVVCLCLPINTLTYFDSVEVP